MPKKIFDCFCYFNERELLELRLQTLWDHVDIFVIVESDFTTTGKPKGEILDQAVLRPYKTKVRYIHVSDCPGGQEDVWLNERSQRNQIVRGMTDLEDDDWIMISDLDEIPNPESIQSYDPRRFIRGDFEQQMFGYKLNNRLVEPHSEQNWFGTKITTGRYFREFFLEDSTSVRIWKSSGLLRSFKRWWFKRWSFQNIKDGGWHFSWATPEPYWAVKFASFAHQEFSNNGKRPLDDMRQLVEGGRDLIFPGRRYERLDPSDPSLPEPVRTKPEKFRSILFEALT